MRSKKTYLGNFNSIEMGVVLNSASNGNLFTLPTNSLGKYLVDYSESNVTGSCMFIPIINFKFDESKIRSLYNITQSNTVSTQSVNTSSVDTASMNYQALYQQTLIQKNNLQNQLNILSSQSVDSSAISTNMASSTTIIDLRIKLGQGSSSADFSTVFPYLPISK